MFQSEGDRIRVKGEYLVKLCNQEIEGGCEWQIWPNDLLLNLENFCYEL